MNKHTPVLNRRSFVIGTAAVGAGLAIGFDLPFGGPDMVPPPTALRKSMPGW